MKKKTLVQRHNAREKRMYRIKMISRYIAIAVLYLLGVCCAAAIICDFNDFVPLIVALLIKFSSMLGCFVILIISVEVFDWQVKKPDIWQERIPVSDTNNEFNELATRYEVLEAPKVYKK